MDTLEKILHVDDDQQLVEIVGLALELIGGFQIKQAENGSSAIELLDGFTPQLIVTDVQMPDLTGPEMMEQIRKLPDYKDCPAIYLTARVGPENHKLLSDPNDLAIIVKPFDPMTLADEIRDIWKAKYSA